MNDERLRWALEQIAAGLSNPHPAHMARWAMGRDDIPEALIQRLDKRYAATFKLKRDG